MVTRCWCKVKSWPRNELFVVLFTVILDIARFVCSLALMKRLHELVTILHFMQKLDKSWGSIPPRSTSTFYICSWSHRPP